MVQRHVLVPLILRAAIFLYLFCQMLFCLAFLFFEIFFLDMMQRNDPQDPNHWLWLPLVLFGIVGFGSAILDQGLLHRKNFGKQRVLFILLAALNALAGLYLLLYIHAFHVPVLNYLTGYGLLFLVNFLILGVVLSRRLTAYIFPPKT